MRVPGLPLLTFSLVLGLLAATTLPAHAAEIKCGSILGPGGTFVLDRDLTCPPNPNDHYEPAVIVRGARLDLNGHTVSCGRGDASPGRQFGIEVFQSKILNGTVTGCGEAVRAFGSVVKRLRVSDSGFGIYMQGGDDNLIKNNIATQNAVGFGLEDGSGRNTLLNNTATENDRGFYADSGDDNVFVGNRATDNERAGFALAGERLRMTGNISNRNGEGFSFDSHKGQVEIVGNVAKGNRTHGFSIADLGNSGDTRIVLRDNLARRNGGDGFVIQPTFLGPGDPSDNLLANNSAINNKGHGFHITVGPAYPPQILFSHATISGNTSIGHTAPHFDLADDNANCQEGTIWQDNTFHTASQACID